MKVGGGSASLLSVRGGRCGGVLLGKDFVLGSRRRGDVGSGVVAGSWSLFWTISSRGSADSAGFAVGGERRRCGLSVLEVAGGGFRLGRVLAVRVPRSRFRPSAADGSCGLLSQEKVCSPGLVRRRIGVVVFGDGVGGVGVLCCVVFLGVRVFVPVFCTLSTLNTYALSSKKKKTTFHITWPPPPPGAASGWASACMPRATPAARSRTGTVRYLGTVDGHAGEWVGVDWDGGAGGRHDGSLAGRRYFAAAGDRSASFMRPSALSGGIALPDALRLRYRVDDFTKEEEDEMYVFLMSQKRVSVELVGTNKAREKLKNFDELMCASVSFMGVSSTGSPEELQGLVPNLRQLDLTGNLLSQWQDISSLCQALQSLEVLDLTNNTMENDTVECPLLKNIRVLVLNNCGVTWELIEKIKVSLAYLNEVHLIWNKMNIITSRVGQFVQGFNALRLLNLEDNHIDSWDEIVRLSYLTSLEQLHLNKNKIKHVTYPSNLPSPGPHVDAEFPPFEKLQVLLLGSNEIDDFPSVDSLNLFPSLMDVRISDNPIADPAKGGVPRFVLVARLGKAKILNGSEVSPRERREAEIRYVRLVMGKKESDDPEVIKQLHPRFAELKALHGIEDEKPTSRTLGPQKMASGLISITLKCVGPSMGEKQALTKKLPPTTTVGKLKSLCESFFKLKDIKLRLFLEEEGCPLPQLLEEETASLIELGIGTLATIIVDEET